MTDYKSHFTYDTGSVTAGSYSKSYDPPVGKARFLVQDVYFKNPQSIATGTLTVTIDSAKGSSWDVAATYSVTAGGAVHQTGLSINMDFDDKLVVAYTGVQSGTLASSGTFISRVVFKEELRNRDTFI